MENPVALKCLSVMLALVMAFLFVPPYVFGKGLPETEVETAGPEAKTEKLKDSLYTLLSSLSDGSTTLACYEYPVKYVDSDGTVREKSLKLSDAGHGFESASSKVLHMETLDEIILWQRLYV